MKLIVAIPAYNEERTLRSVLQSIPSRIDGIDELEIVVVDDGSSDKTAKIAHEAGAEVISHAENLGLGKTFVTGVKIALAKKADVMAVIDGDGQFNGEDIPQLILPVVKGEADFVSGSRFIKEFPQSNIPLIRVAGNKALAYFLSMAAGRKLSDVSCGFRAYSRETLFHLNLFGKFTYTQESILNIAYKGLVMREIPIHVTYFPDRKSHITGSLGKYIFRSLNIILRTVLDYQPLAVFGGVGLVLFLAGLALDVFMLYVYVQTGQFSPYKSFGVLGLTLNFSGLLLLIVGLVADMLNRIRHNQERILYYQKKNLYD